MACKWLGRTCSSATATHGMGLSPCARVSAVKQPYHTREEKNDYKSKDFLAWLFSPVPPSRPLLEVKVAGVSTSILKPGTMALITCTAQVHHLKLNMFANWWGLLFSRKETPIPRSESPSMANLLDPRSSGGAETLSLSQVSFLHQMAMGWILLNFLLTIDDKMNPHYKIENGIDCLDFD